MRLYTITVQTDDLVGVDDPLLDMPIKEKKSMRDKMRNELM
jgi:hypothetical protein